MPVTYCSQMSMYKSKTIVNHNYQRFKHVCHVRILKCGERNQRSKFLILFKLVVSKIPSYFSYILSPQNNLICSISTEKHLKF